MAFAEIYQTCSKSKVTTEISKQQWCQQQNTKLSDEEILAAKEYFFRKATLEVKSFTKPTQYQKIFFLSKWYAHVY